MWRTKRDIVLTKICLVQDEQISAEMNKLHTQRAKTFNEDKNARPSFSEGDQVWVLKPKSLSSQSKLEPRWNGPMTVQKRLGNSSYSLMDLYGDKHSAHLDQMKPFTDDLLGEKTFLEFHGPSHFSSHTQRKNGTIKAHRCLTPQKYEFLVHWNHEDDTEGVWENSTTFLRNGQLKSLWDYCVSNNIPLGVSDLFPNENEISSNSQ